MFSSVKNNNEVSVKFGIVPVLLAIFAGTVLIILHYVLCGNDSIKFALKEVFNILLLEGGVSLYVASIVWLVFEYVSHTELNDHWNRRIEVMSRRVFWGAFRKDFPETLIKEASTLFIDQNFIRSGLNLTYTICDQNYVDRFGNDMVFVRLNTVARYKIRNISNVTSSIPVGIMLPNPLIDEMKPFCKVNKIAIKEGVYGEGHTLSDINFDNIDTSKAEKKFREEIRDDNKYQVMFFIRDIDVLPGHQVEILVDYVMAKEDEDTEIFQTMYAADSVNVTVVDTNPLKRVVRARAIHPSALEDDTSEVADGTYNFKLQRYLLPHQGIAIWWKNIPRKTL
jgi:hypothetical protein